MDYWNEEALLRSERDGETQRKARFEPEEPYEPDEEYEYVDGNWRYIAAEDEDKA